MSGGEIALRKALASLAEQPVEVQAGRLFSRYPKLSTLPITIKAAKRVVARVHRRRKALTGALWAVQLRVDDRLAGVAVVGRPVSRMLQGEGDFLAERLEVVRVAVVERTPNGCSMLYGACARAARAMGALSLHTYTRCDEPGTTLRAAGWLRDEDEDGEPLLFGGGQRDRPCRPRERDEDDSPRHRWWAAWSVRP